MRPERLSRPLPGAQLCDGTLVTVCYYWMQFLILVLIQYSISILILYCLPSSISNSNTVARSCVFRVKHKTIIVFSTVTPHDINNINSTLLCNSINAYFTSYATVMETDRGGLIIVNVDKIIFLATTVDFMI
jgi:hypothetical protein